MGVSALAVATAQGLFIARGGPRWTVEEHLREQSPECVAVDPLAPGRVYCGTWGHGLWRSGDGGRSWAPAGEGIPHREITAVAVAPPASPGSPFGTVYAGTEPSALFRSDDGGETWTELSGLRALPSASTWSFPPRPETHHVRWIEADPVRAGRVFVAIEAGAFVSTLDGGETWTDRVRGGPYDTHTAATHRLAPDRVYCAAGDGYFETADGGHRWSNREAGLRHHYLVGIAVDPADPDAVVVSAASGPWVAYNPRNAEAYVYRRSGRRTFAQAREGLPAPRGTVASRLAVNPAEPGVIYAANNHGAFRSADAGRSWTALEAAWPRGAFTRGVDALTYLPD